MLMLILTHVATKLCWSVSSLFKEIQVELDANVDDHDMQLQLSNECNALFFVSEVLSKFVFRYITSYIWCFVI